MADKEKDDTPEPDTTEVDAKAAKKQEAARRAKKADEETKKDEKVAPAPKKGDYGPDFKYIVRLSATDLDGTKQVGVAITNVKGVGRRVGKILAEQTKLDPNELIGNLTDDQVETLQAAMDAAGDTLPAWAVNRPNDYDTGDDLHLVGAAVDGALRDDLNRLKKIRSYRGVRHEAGLRVRGQRTRANGRTGLTVGVQRQKLIEAAAEKKEEES